MLSKAVVKRSEALKNLQEATGSRDTVLTSVNVAAHKVEIEQTQQMLQEAQKAHNNVPQVVQATEEPTVQQHTVPMGLHLLQDARV